MIRFVTRLALASMVVACTEGITDPAAEPNVSSLVTGEAARALDVQGRFVLSRAVCTADQPVIDEGRAAALAVAYVRTCGDSPTFLSILEKQHEGPVSPQDLVASPRVEFTATPYETTPASYGAPTRRAMGPYFLVRLLQGSTPAATVAVSVYATEFEIREGRLVYPRESGGEFESYGNPLSQGTSRPISPERATQVVARATGAKITHVPELLRPDWQYNVLYSRWMLTPDRPVSLRGVETGRTYQTTSVYVGQGYTADGHLALEPAMFVSLPSQPPSNDPTPQISLKRRPDKPLEFEEVRP